jgi:hypothetical protein
MYGPKTNSAVKRTIMDLLDKEAESIDEVHERLGEAVINIQIKIGKIGRGGTECAVGLTYVKEKVKASADFSVDEKQLPLFNPFEVKEDVAAKAMGEVFEMKVAYAGNGKGGA